ncbi:MAG: hypothetical protein K0S11_1536, partial [Gammaproteobacteria bacterium]|nr:hypothetical protein [Gammaproteobacteria bacterium]
MPHNKKLIYFFTIWLTIIFIGISAITGWP